MRLIGILGATWGTIGVFGILGFAVWRLAPIAWEAYASGFGVLEWAVFGGWMVFMMYAEGYRGFQKRFSPRTAARIHYLSKNPTGLHVVLAPFFSMGYFHATKRTKIVAWSLTLGVISLVLLVRLLAQPWRGIVDAGVVVGLSWGMVSLAIFLVRAFTRGEADASPEVPQAGGD